MEYTRELDSKNIETGKVLKITQAGDFKTIETFDTEKLGESRELVRQRLLELESRTTATIANLQAEKDLLISHLGLIDAVI